MSETAQIALTVLGSVLASSGIWSMISKWTERKDIRTKMLLGLAHDRIMSLGMEYISRGNITQSEYENLHKYLYVPYKKMGGNGSADRIMKEIDRLKIVADHYS